MKRMIAAIAALGALAVAAEAQPQPALAAWTDPANQVTFTRPANWPVDRMGDSSPQLTHYAAGLADAECSVYTIERPETAAIGPAAVRTAFSQPFTNEQWVQIASGMTSVFPAPVTVQTMSVNTSQFWPMERATIMTGTTRVESAVIGRPGREIRAFCQSFDSRDRTATFTAILDSLATPQDAALQAQAEAAAAPATPPAAPAPAHH